MAVFMKELASSRKTDVGRKDATVTLDYIVWGSQFEDDVINALLDGTPLYWGYIQRKKVSANPEGGLVWTGHVEYGDSQGDTIPGEAGAGTPPAEPALTDPLGAEFSWDTTGGTRHITQSKQTRYSVGYGVGTIRSFDDGFVANGTNLLVSLAEAAFTNDDVGATITGPGIPDGTTITTVTPPGQATLSANATANTTDAHYVITTVGAGTGSAEDYQRAIGVSKDGVAGCDIVAPKLEFTIARNFSFVTLNYLRNLSYMTSTMNDNTYFGFQKGELLFLGSSGQGNLSNPNPDERKVHGVFKFAASKNQTNVDLVDDIEVGFTKLHPLRLPFVGGWDVVWCAYDFAKGNKEIVQRPKSAYVERVYDYSDFKKLGL